jgi:hypothetical protein
MSFSNIKDELCNIPSLNPGKPKNFGEDRISQEGEKLEGTYSESRWGFDFEISDEWHHSEKQTAPDAIADILAKLEPYKQIFNDLAKSGCDIELILSIGLDGNAGEIFKPELLQRLSQFNISLGFDIYPPDKA